MRNSFPYKVIQFQQIQLLLNFSSWNNILKNILQYFIVHNLFTLSYFKATGIAQYYECFKNE